MSIAITHSAPPARNRLRPVLDWLRHARIALEQAHEARPLPAHLLTDIGETPTDIARAVDHDVARLGLLDLGWQQPRRGY